MKILFNKKFLQHNVDSHAEVANLIHNFNDVSDTYVDGEKCIRHVHTKEYK